jgi:DNA end-binding protein Ku
MRKKRYAGAVHSSNGYLLLETLRHTEELVRLESLRPPVNRAPDKREIALAEQLIEALADEFDPAAYKDEYRDAVMQLLEAKARGKVVRFPAKAAPKPRGDSLLANLQASLKGRKRAAGG